MSAFRRAISGTDPSHFQLKLFILAVLVRNVDNPSRLLNSIKQTQVPRLKIQFLQLGLGSLSALSGRGTVIALDAVSVYHAFITDKTPIIPNIDRLVQSCRGRGPLPLRPRPSHQNRSVVQHRLGRQQTTLPRSPNRPQWQSHQMGGHWSTEYKPGRSRPTDRPRLMWGWVPCMSSSMTRPHLWPSTQSDGRRGSAQKRPRGSKKGINISFKNNSHYFLCCNPAVEMALLTIPILRSTVAILLFAPGFRSLLVMIFSTARTTPSLHLIPIDVPAFSTALTAYSTYNAQQELVSRGVQEVVREGRFTWKFLPSGEKTEFERS